LIADLSVSSQVLGEKQEVEAKPKRPNTDDPRQNPAVQGKSKMQRTRREEVKMDRDHHGQPVVATFPPIVSFSLRGLSFSCAVFETPPTPIGSEPLILQIF